MTARSINFTIPNAGYQSNIIDIGADVLISTVFVPTQIVGNDLLFFGDPGDGIMQQLNFVFDLTSTTPYFKGQVVTDMSAKFAGLTRLQVQTGVSDTQTQDILITMGLTY